MLYNDVILAIVRAVGDESDDRLYEQARDHFMRAVSTLMRSQDYTEDDVPGFVEIADISFGDGANTYEDISDIDLLRIVDIFPDPGTATGDQYEQNVSVKTIEEIRRVAINSEFAPGDNEIYIYRVGGKLYPVTSTGNAFTLGTDTLKMVYFVYPDDNDWGTDTELVGTLFSQPFVDAAINRSIETLAAVMGG